MMILLVALSALTLRSGDVCTISQDSLLRDPGRSNWTVPDRVFRLAAGSRMIVTRINPEQTVDVAEVRIYDGTNRLGWISTSFLRSLERPVRLDAAPKIVKIAMPPPDPRNRGGPMRRRVRRRPDFSTVDAVIYFGLRTMFYQHEQEQMRINNEVKMGLLPGGSANLPFLFAPPLVPGGSGIWPEPKRECGATTSDGSPCHNRPESGGRCSTH